MKAPLPNERVNSMKLNESTIQKDESVHKLSPMQQEPIFRNPNDINSFESLRRKSDSFLRKKDMPRVQESKLGIKFDR